MDTTTVKQRQQAAWASGDYAAVGSRLALVAELLCEAVDLRAGNRVTAPPTGRVAARALAALGTVLVHAGPAGTTITDPGSR
jgi:hypothetical protein